MLSDAVEQDELIIQEQEQREMASYYAIPVRYMFDDNDPDEWLYRKLWRRLR
jgi:hypothetical protein